MGGEGREGGGEMRSEFGEARSVQPNFGVDILYPYILYVHGMLQRTASPSATGRTPPLGEK